MPNLYVLVRDGVEIGFVQKPRDSKTDKNAWRAFFGIGDKASFLDHAWTLGAAKALVESHNRFRVASVSSNTNSFGLRGHVLIAEDGQAFEVARSTPWFKGQIIVADPRNWAALGCEIPRELAKAPAAVVAEVWRAE